MAKSIRQQILISGIGGQGVLFVTRLLAEAAIARGLPVFTCETHGMAQRGGTVVSHLKVGEFYSPLIRAGQADGMLVLKSENLAQHGVFLKPSGWRWSMPALRKRWLCREPDSQWMPMTLPKRLAT